MVGVVVVRTTKSLDIIRALPPRPACEHNMKNKLGRKRKNSAALPKRGVVAAAQRNDDSSIMTADQAAWHSTCGAAAQRSPACIIKRILMAAALYECIMYSVRACFRVPTLERRGADGLNKAETAAL